MHEGSSRWSLTSETALKARFILSTCGQAWLSSRCMQMVGQDVVMHTAGQASQDPVIGLLNPASDYFTANLDAS